MPPPWEGDSNAVLIRTPYSDVVDLLHRGIASDYAVHVNGGTPVHAHRAILAWRVPYFEKMFNFLQDDGGGPAPQQGNSSHIALHNADVLPRHVDTVMRHVYGSDIRIDSLSDVPPILAVASYFLLEDFCNTLRRAAASCLADTSARILGSLHGADALLLNAIAAATPPTLRLTSPQHLPDMVELAVEAGSPALLNSLVVRFLDYSLCPEVHAVAVRHDAEDLAEHCLLHIARHARQDLLLGGPARQQQLFRPCLPRLPLAAAADVLRSDCLNVHSEAEAALLAACAAQHHPDPDSARRLLDGCIRGGQPCHTSAGSTGVCGGVDRGVMHAASMRLLALCGAVAHAAADTALHVTVKLLPLGMGSGEWELERLRVLCPGGAELRWAGSGGGGGAAWAAPWLASSGDFGSSTRDFSCGNLLLETAGMTWSAPQGSADASHLLLRLPNAALRGSAHLTFPPYAERPMHIRVLASRDGTQFVEAPPVKVSPTRTNIVDLREVRAALCGVAPACPLSGKGGLPCVP